jgi:hypothetical protein
MRKAKSVVGDASEKRWTNAMFSTPLYQRLKASAARENRSMAGQIRHIVEQYPDREDAGRAHVA